MVGSCLVYLTGPDDNTTGGPANQETIKEMDKELTRVIEDFGCAVDVETLCLSKETGTGNVWSLAGVPSLADIAIPIQCK